MPRGRRVDGPGTVHHVMIRGLERREIFRDDADRWNLIERLERLIPLWGGSCFAWVLMGNHIHLLLRSRDLSLAWLMRRVNTGFATRFNRRHERVGYLFQNRFKSRLVSDEADLLNLLRYVHLNPLRASLVDDLDALARFPWAGHGALVGYRRAFAFENVELVLSLFGAERAAARKKLREWMALPLDGDCPLPDALEGDAAEQHDLLAAAALPGPRTQQHAAPSLDELVDQISRRFSVSPHELARGARHERATRARAVIAFIAVVRRGLPITEVAGRLGVSGQAVGKAISRGERVTREEEPTPRGWL
jgi:putative transposase